MRASIENEVIRGCKAGHKAIEHIAQWNITDIDRAMRLSIKEVIATI